MENLDRSKTALTLLVTTSKKKINSNKSNATWILMEPRSFECRVKDNLYWLAPIKQYNIKLLERCFL